MRKVNNKAQAIIEIGIFGAIVIFLLGAIIRTHLSNTQAQSHQIKAMKLALLQSFKGYNNPAKPNSSHNSATVLFIEDRFAADLNKFGTIERTPFIASGSGTMSNRLMFPIDSGEVRDNLPIMDVFINGQHFPLTTAAFVFRPVYQQSGPCPDDAVAINGSRVYGQEHYNCQRQQREWAISSGTAPLFFSIAVNGTAQFCSHGCLNDFLTEDQSFNLKRDGDFSSNPPYELHPSMAWQWYAVPGDSGHIESKAPSNTPEPFDGRINFGASQNGQPEPNYPSLDMAGTLHEQTIYQITYLASSTLNDAQHLNNPSLIPYKINGLFLSLTQQLNNSGTININALCLYHPGIEGPPQIPGATPPALCPSSGTITGAAVLDSQLGDIDLSFDPKTSQGGINHIGLLPQMAIFTWVSPDGTVGVNQGPSHGGTYLEIKEGQLYNPETHRVVRSVSRTDHVDLISHMIQLSNNTGRFCQISLGTGISWMGYPVSYSDYAQANNGEANPVQACGDCWTTNFALTCFEPASRILYVRSSIGDTHVRKWFTDVTKGL